jgi:ElaB/YqjD/DUF883 family membrane-anchored ribosome-binding protein
MGQSQEELKQDIQSTRADLSETLDAIGDRVSPGRMIERRTNRVRQGLQGLRDRVMGKAQDAVDTTKERLSTTADTIREAPEAGLEEARGNPLVAGALAFGVGFLVASVMPRTQAEERAAAQLADRVEPLKQELTDAGQEAIEQLKEPARQAATGVTEAAKSGAQSVAQQARQGMEDTTSAGREAAEELKS